MSSFDIPQNNLRMSELKVGLMGFLDEALIFNEKSVLTSPMKNRTWGCNYFIMLPVGSLVPWYSSVLKLSEVFIQFILQLQLFGVAVYAGGLEALCHQQRRLEIRPSSTNLSCKKMVNGMSLRDCSFASASAACISCEAFVKFDERSSVTLDLFVDSIRLGSHAMKTERP